MSSQDMRPPLPVNDPIVIASMDESQDITTSGHAIVSASMPTTKEQVAVELQQQEVHPSKNIQHGLDLWNRVREYDERSAAEDFSPVLTRKDRKSVV